MAESTIEGHIVKLMQEGEMLNWRLWVPEDTESKLRALFDTHGTTALKPIIEAANGAITYTQARILRVVIECGDSSPLSAGHFSDTGQGSQTTTEVAGPKRC